MYESKGKASPILYSYLVDGVTISINRYHVGAVGLFGGSTMNKIKYHGGIGSLNVPLSIEHYVSPGRLLLGSSWLLFFKVNKTKKKGFHHFLQRQIMKKRVIFLLGKSLLTAEHFFVFTLSPVRWEECFWSLRINHQITWEEKCIGGRGDYPVIV